MADDPEATNPPLRRATDLPADAPWYARWIEANVKEAYKWASVQVPLFYSACMVYYAMNQEQVHQWVQANVPAKYWPWIGLAACIWQIAARVVKLPKKEPQ